jgi:hypothetical protein
MFAPKKIKIKAHPPKKTVWGAISFSFLNGIE